jgi:hypothetical protein
MWNWMMVRPERLLLTAGAVVVALLAGSVVYSELRPPYPTPPHIEGSVPFTDELRAAWQANCERLQQPDRQCGN